MYDKQVLKVCYYAFVIEIKTAPSAATDLTVSMLQQELSIILHFSVARCIVSIMANASLVSETLLTKRAILSDALQAYTHM